MRHKVDLHARLSFDRERIGKEEFVVVGGYQRQWTHKSVLHDSDVVGKNVDLSENIGDKLIKVVLVEHIYQTVSSHTLDDFLMSISTATP